MLCDKLKFNETNKELYTAAAITFQYGLKAKPEIVQKYNSMYPLIDEHIDSIKKESFIKMFSNLKKLTDVGNETLAVKYFCYYFLKLNMFISKKYSVQLNSEDFDGMNALMEAITGTIEDSMHFTFEVN